MGYSPDAIRHVWEQVHAAIPATALGGIYTDKPGYHNARANLPGSDYSVQLADDKLGDSQAGAALDITFHNTDDEIRLMKRLNTAGTSGDRRVWNLREWIGTTDGNTVKGYDPRGGYYFNSDDLSHLWHIHISWYRKYTNDMDTARDVVSVLLAGDRDEDDMNKEDTMALISAAIQSLMYGGSHGSWADADYAWIDDPNNGIGDRLSRCEQDKITRHVVEQFAWSYHFGGDNGPWTHKAYPSLIADAGHGIDDRLRELE
jgi:hypothetical protein